MNSTDPKSHQLIPAVDALAKQLFGRSRSASHSSGTCVTCGGPAVDFRDDISRVEYGISGMCQACQDSVFGE